MGFGGTTAESVLGQILDPANRADPYPLYDRLRAEGPAPIGVMPGLLTACHDQCAAALRDPGLSSDRRKSPVFAGVAGQLSGVGALVGKVSFLYQDPPDHTRLRRLVSRAFTARAVEALRPRTRQLVDAALDRAGQQGCLDVVDELAYPVPLAIISELLGVPVADHALVRLWSQELTQTLDPFVALTGRPAASLPALTQLAEQFEAYFTDLLGERRAHPRDDLITHLLQVTDQGDQLTPDDLLTTLMLLLVGGHETTVNLISNGVLALIRHPDSWQRLAADPSLAGQVVEEVLRWDAPVTMTVRNALADMEVGGVPLATGGLLVLLLAGANRDGSRFPDPDRFDIDRRDNRHLAFGAGPHFCLGAPLARMEAEVTLARVVARVVRPALVESTLEYKPHVVFRGLARLPVGFSAIRPAGP